MSKLVSKNSEPLLKGVAVPGGDIFTLGKVCGFYSNIFLASLSIAFLGVSENITLFRISGPKGVYVHDGGSS